MVVSDGNVAIAALIGLARYFGEDVPDTRTLAIDISSPFDLIGGGRRPPKKVLGKRF
jgi:hypothetical protein